MSIQTNMTTTAPAPRRTAKFVRRIAVAAVSIASAATLVTGTATPAAAARSIAPPSGYTCGGGIIAVAPPRVWASNRTEQVAWLNAVQRWDDRRQVWYTYATYVHYASFTTLGQSPTSWSMGNTNRGGRYINSRMNLTVSHQGYYRVAAAINGSQGGVTSTGFVAGPDAYCWMP